MPVLIETDRLVLREFRENDWQAVHAYASDPGVAQWMEWGPNSEEQTKDFIRRAISFQTEQPRTQFELAIVLKKGDLLIGGCGLRLQAAKGKSVREAEIGYCLHRDSWRRGYATEAAGALLRFGFETLKLRRVFATTGPMNVASIRVLEKVGLKQQPSSVEPKWVKGRWRESLLFVLIVVG